LENFGNSKEKLQPLLPKQKVQWLEQNRKLFTRQM